MMKRYNTPMAAFLALQTADIITFSLFENVGSIFDIKNDGSTKPAPGFEPNEE